MFPLSFFNLRKFIIIEIVFRIHLNNLGFCWSSHYFDDLDQVINTTLSYKEWGTVKHLKNDTTQRPNVNHCSIMSSTKYKLGSTVAS